MRTFGARIFGPLGRLVLLLGSALLLGTACGGGGPAGSTGGSANLCILNVNVGFFTYCAEYVGFTESLCTQSMGMYNAQCASGYVGYCETTGNVNPRRTYFYGNAITQQSVQSVCPGGKYVPGSIPDAGR